MEFLFFHGGAEGSWTPVRGTFNQDVYSLGCIVFDLGA